MALLSHMPSWPTLACSLSLLKTGPMNTKEFTHSFPKFPPGPWARPLAGHVHIWGNMTCSRDSGSSLRAKVASLKPKFPDGPCGLQAVTTLISLNPIACGLLFCIHHSISVRTRKKPVKKEELWLVTEWGVMREAVLAREVDKGGGGVIADPVGPHPLPNFSAATICIFSP